MKIYLKTIILLVSVLFLPTSVFAEGSDKPLLFSGPNCPGCINLSAQLNSRGIDTLLSAEKIELESVEDIEQYENALSICKQAPVVPMLVADEKCYIGDWVILEKAAEITEYAFEDGDTIDISKSSSTAIDIEILKEKYQKIEDAETKIEEEADDVENSNETVENETLADRIFGNDGIRPRDDVSAKFLFASLLAPITLIGIAYYLITRFKL